MRAFGVSRTVCRKREPTYLERRRRDVTGKMCENERKSVEKNGRLRSIQTAHFGGLAALARLSSLLPRSLCCSTFDQVGRHKTPREASRARARLGRRQRRSRAGVSTRRWVDLRSSGDDVRDPHPSGASGEMASDGAPALNDQTHANIGADAEVSPATPALKDRIDRPDVPGTCLSLRTLEGTSGSPPLVPRRWALRRFVCASAATRRRAPGFAPARFQKASFRRFGRSVSPRVASAHRPSRSLSRRTQTSRSATAGTSRRWSASSPSGAATWWFSARRGSWKAAREASARGRFYRPRARWTNRRTHSSYRKCWTGRCRTPTRRACGWSPYAPGTSSWTPPPRTCARSRPRSGASRSPPPPPRRCAPTGTSAWKTRSRRARGTRRSCPGTCWTPSSAC